MNYQKKKTQNTQKWFYFQWNNQLLTCEIKVPSLFLDFINSFDQYWSDFLFPALPLLLFCSLSTAFTTASNFE